MGKFKSIMAVLSVAIPFTGFFSTAIGEEGSGGQGGAFLRMGVGARAVAMGGAFTAIADDATATYWNPAGLGQVKSRQLGAMYSMMSLDRTHNFVSYAHPGSIGTFGISWINFGVSKIDGRDRYANPTGDFSDSEMAFMLSYGESFANIFYIGASAKYLVHSLANNKASGFGLDVGALLNISGVISIGAVIQDIGSSITWNTFSKYYKETFPTQIRVGTAVSPKLLPIKLAVEMEKNSKEEAKYHAGAEYWLLKMLAIRGGYSSKGLTAGGSVKVPAGMLNLQVDYAFATDKLDEEAVHKISLMIEF